MGTVIAQRGIANTGKTTTIRLLRALLLQEYPDAERTYETDTPVEVRVVIALGGFKLGIESLGDPGAREGRLEPSLDLFVRLRCAVIICATRTSGGTVEAVEALADHGYEIIWRDRNCVRDLEKQKAENLAEATWMLDQIKDRLAAAAA